MKSLISKVQGGLNHAGGRKEGVGVHACVCVIMNLCETGKAEVSVLS